MNFERLDKKVTIYWMIARAILFVIFFVPYIIGAFYIPKEALLAYLVPTTIIVLILLIYAFVFPYLERKVYGYYLDEEKVVITRGVLFKRYIVIPDVQIQDISINEGPIQMAFKICNISISTAGSTNFITCISKEKGEEIVEKLRERITLRLKKEEKDA